MIGRRKLLSWLYRDHSPIGIDIGRDSIKMLQLRRRAGQWQVAASAIYSFGQTVRQTPDLRRHQAAEAIRSLLASQPFRGNRVVASLNHEQVLVKNARLPLMPAAELVEAVRWEAADRFPFDVTGGVVRHLLAGQVRQSGDQLQEVLLLAASDQALREQLRLLEDARCQPVGLDAQPVALSRAMSYFAPAAPGPLSAQVLADLGAQSCLFLILRRGQILFVKVIEIGSNDLTRAVAERVGIGFEDAAAVRMRMGTDGSAAPEYVTPSATDSKVNKAVALAIRPVLERLAHEMTLCLRYFSVSFRGNRPESVMLVGGAAHDRLLIGLLSEALGAAVQVGRPLADFRPDEWTCQWGGGPAGGGPEWATALGCCLKPLAKAGSAGQSGAPDSADWVASPAENGTETVVEDMTAATGQTEKSGLESSEVVV